MQNSIIVTGDIHCKWNILNILINRKVPKYVLICGDFGYWPSLSKEETTIYSTSDIKIKKKPWSLYGIKNTRTNTKVHWCPGNHEDWWALKQLENTEIYKDVFYMSRGAYLSINGKNILFMGGAESTDKLERSTGIDWFPEEIISEGDMYNLPDVHIDIVISHTCPIEFTIEDKFPDINANRLKDPCRYALSHILNTYHPSQWFFGHFHKYMTGYNSGCNWTCLDKAGGNERWFQQLKI